MTPGAETLPDLTYALSRMLGFEPDLVHGADRQKIANDPAVLAAWDDLPRKGRAPGVWWDLDADPIRGGGDLPGVVQTDFGGEGGSVMLSGDVAMAFMLARVRGSKQDKQRWAILWAAVWRHLWLRDAEYAAHTAHWSACELASSRDPGPVLFEAVRAVLDDQSEGDPLAAEALKDGGAIARYAAELLAEARRVVGKVMPPPYRVEGKTGFHPGPDWPLHETAETDAGPALRWDVAHAEELEPSSKAIALRKAAERWQPSQVELPVMPARPGAVYALWLDDVDGVPRWLGLIGRSLWVSRWRPGALFEQAKRGPAIPLLLRRSIRQIRSGVNISEPERGGFDYLALDGTTVARFSAPAMNRKQLEAMQRGVKHLRGMLFERVSRGLVRDCFEQAAAGVNPCTRLVWAKGFEGVAAAYGVNSKDRARLPELFEAMHAYRGSDRSIPPLLGGFWLTGSTRGRAAELRCDVGEALAPGYASVVAGMTGTARGDQWLLPVLPVPLLAVEGAAPADYGALCDLQWELLSLFRERAEEGRDQGGWMLDAADLAAVADRAELRSKLAGAWLDPWTTGPRAWLKKLPNGRLELVDQAAAAMLREAADYTTTARRRGARSKAKRTKTR